MHLPHPLAHLLTADTAITRQFKAALWPRSSAGSLRFRGEGVGGLGGGEWECIGSGLWAAGINTGPPSAIQIIIRVRKSIA